MKRFKKYLLSEINIEFKACLYFFAFLFYVCCCLFFANGETTVSMLHMAEIILATYCMGYLQVFLLDNFEEAEQLTPRYVIYMLLCSFVYAALDYLLNWTFHSIALAVGFFFYSLLCYLCVFLIYKLRRTFESEQLNNDLMSFKNQLNQEEGNE